MRQVIIWLGVALAVGSVVLVSCMLFITVPVVLIDPGSKSSQRFLNELAGRGVKWRWVMRLGSDTMEVDVRWIHAARVVELAKEIDPTGMKIVCVYPRDDSRRRREPFDPERP